MRGNQLLGSGGDFFESADRNITDFVGSTNASSIDNNFHSTSEEPEPPDLLNLNSFPGDPVFQSLVRKAEVAINNGVLPLRIEQGSSGSYFIRDESKEVIAVFKPKSEEPYSSLNPKYGKWCQRVCCPCCFGRNCLLPEQGYLSEAGASVVDEWLKLDIVPKTKVVWLSSETFHYSKIAKAKSNAKKEIMAKTPNIGKRFKRLGLPLKVGSFQTFMKGYVSAEEILRRFSCETMSTVTLNNFQLQFEKLVILDYIIRNTDRGNDNWLIKVDMETNESNFSNECMSGDTDKHVCEENDGICSSNEWSMINNPVISIAAIDNGLAFPFKHPDTWRSYPFHWAWLQPHADTPFSEETVSRVLPLITDLNYVESLTSQLECLFSIDTHFDSALFEKQMSVLRGQIMNLGDALNRRITPSELVEMPLRLVERRKYPSRTTFGFNRFQNDSPPLAQSSQYEETYQDRRPFFTWC